jgi:hypothetical protein
MVVWLNKNTKDTTSIIAMLMVSAILIHAMLEFPQRYAYFLLPMGFLLGLIQAQTPNLKGITLHKNVIRGCWVISLVLLFMIWRDYKVFRRTANCYSRDSNLQQKLWGVHVFYYLPIPATFNLDCIKTNSVYVESGFNAVG